MVSSRLRRHEERKASKKILIAVVGSLALLVFIGFFGLRILVGFSLLVDRIRGTTPEDTQQNTILQPPVLDSLPEATHSAAIAVSGRGQAGAELILYVNDDEYKTVTIADDGQFIIDDISVKEGQVRVNAKIRNEEKSTSNFSNTISTHIDHTPPKLAVDSPQDQASINDGTKRVTVNGITEGVRVTVNGYVAVIKSDGSFSYSAPLTEGSNTITVIAVDEAGNETRIERAVTYLP